MTRRLHIVPPPSKEEPEDALDLNAKARAEIMKRDWAAVHTSADKRGPVAVGDARKRTWRA